MRPKPPAPSESADYGRWKAALRHCSSASGFRAESCGNAIGGNSTSMAQHRSEPSRKRRFSTATVGHSRSALSDNAQLVRPAASVTLCR
jgi:hypothetical protein